MRIDKYEGGIFIYFVITLLCRQINASLLYAYILFYYNFRHYQYFSSLRREVKLNCQLSCTVHKIVLQTCFFNQEQVGAVKVGEKKSYWSYINFVYHVTRMNFDNDSAFFW